MVADLWTKTMEGWGRKKYFVYLFLIMHVCITQQRDRMCTRPMAGCGDAVGRETHPFHKHTL